MPPRYKHSRPASSVAVRNQPIARPSTASPPPISPPTAPGASNLSNDEVLAHMMSRMDMFDTRLNGMESMIADRFQSIEIMHGSLNSHIDTMQGQYQGIASQLQTVIQLLQLYPSPPPED
ncbi:hypothetical protein JCGZ_22080 [Jatropha curcas]|uniref:Uncharacterized protein n=1 Tax=Jatropha curcas TaxID=180498 RepID=A0A067JSM4_JATCU|nr:hypothetical protein JCGZ_22080 [Jatropha curcas]